MAHELNSSTLIARRDYGMKIAMPGFDVQYAGDNELLFNSSFPVLQIKIFASLRPDSIGSPFVNNGGELFATYGTAPNRTYLYRWKHDLGFVPFVTCLYIGAYFSPYSADEKYIYCPLPENDYLHDFDKVVAGRVLIAPIDITKDIEYPYTALPLAIDNANISDYGFKSIKYGDIEASDFNNLGINIRLQSQMVLAVKTDKTAVAANEINYQYPKGMTTNDCMVYAFYKTRAAYDSTSPVVWRQMVENGQAVPSFWRNKYYQDSVSSLYSSGSQVSVVITRLPMVASAQSGSTL